MQGRPEPYCVRTSPAAYAPWRQAHRARSVPSSGLRAVTSTAAKRSLPWIAAMRAANFSDVSMSPHVGLPSRGSPSS